MEVLPLMLPSLYREVFALILSAVGKSGEKGSAFYAAARRVYECESPDRVLLEYQILKNDPDCRFERSLKLLKWMWIEQDVTYWTRKGREMLWDGLEALMDRELPD